MSYVRVLQVFVKSLTGLHHANNIKSKADFTVREIYFSFALIFQKARPFFFRVCLRQDPALLFCRGGPCKHSYWSLHPAVHLTITHLAQQRGMTVLRTTDLPFYRPNIHRKFDY